MNGVNPLEEKCSSVCMAEEETPSTEGVEDVPPASSQGFGFQLPEAIVHAIDRQIVSSGLRLIMFLPAFAAITYFLSWAFSQSLSLIHI